MSQLAGRPHFTLEEKMTSSHQTYESIKEAASDRLRKWGKRPPPVQDPNVIIRSILALASPNGYAGALSVTAPTIAPAESVISDQVFDELFSVPDLGTSVQALAAMASAASEDFEWPGPPIELDLKMRSAHDFYRICGYFRSCDRNGGFLRAIARARQGEDEVERAKGLISILSYMDSAENTMVVFALLKSLPIGANENMAALGAISAAAKFRGRPEIERHVIEIVNNLENEITRVKATSALRSLNLRASDELREFSYENEILRVEREQVAIERAYGDLSLKQAITVRTYFVLPLIAFLLLVAESMKSIFNLLPLATAGESLAPALQNQPAIQSQTPYVPPLGIPLGVWIYMVIGFYIMLSITFGVFLWKGYCTPKKNTAAATFIERLATLLLGAFIGTKM